MKSLNQANKPIANELGLPRPDSLPVSSTVEAVEVTRRASTWSWFAENTLPTDVASPCVHCFREAGRSSCVSVYTACVFLVYAHDTPPRVQHYSFSEIMSFIAY